MSFVATSDSSNPTVFRIDDVTVQASIPTPPATPTGLIASDNAFPDKVLLTWNSVAGATGYQVWRGTSSNPATASFLSDASLNLFQDFNATSGQTYFYFVSATNADGASGLSAGNSGSRAIPQPPLANTGTAQPNGETTALLFGTVNPQGSTTTAWFEWGTTTSYGFMTNPEVIGNGSSVVQVTHGIQGLTPGATYNFRIMGSNGTGTTAGSNLSFTMPAPPVVKPTVTTGDAINITTNTASLEGIVNPNGAPMKSYFEWGPTAAYGNVTESRSYGGTGTSGIDFSEIISGLSPGTPYHYRVVATNSAGTAVGLDQALVTDGTNPVAPSTFAPGNLALPGQVISTATPLFAWQSVVGALEFGLYVSKRQPNGTYSLVFDSDALDLNIPGSATTFTLPNGILVNGGEYRWNMNIRDANGWRNVYSERRYFTFTTGQAPVAPGSLTAVAVDHHTAQLGWPVVPQATGYRVYRALASDGPWTTEVAFTTSNAATDYELDAQTRYYYAVAAVNSAGSSPLSPVASITTPAAPAIPLSPTALTVTLTDQLNVQMSWVGAVPNETYVIERAINGGSFVPLASISGTTSYLDTSHANSTPQTTYGYRVAAVADGVRSAVSVVAEVTRSLTSSVIDAVTRAVLPLLPVSRDGVAKVYRWKYDLDPQAKVASDNAAGLWELVTDLSTLNLGTKKNILLTHGWNDRLDLYGPEASNEFMTIFASDYMDGRLPSEWNNTNILAIDWGQAGALGSDPNGSPELWDEVIKGFAFGAAVGVTVGLITGGPGGAVVGGIKRGLSGAVKSAWKDAVLSSSNGIAAAIPLARRLFDAGIDLSKTTAIGHSNGAGFMASLAITLQLLQPSAEKKLKELVALDAPWPTFAHGAVVNAAPFVEHLTNYYTPSIETNLSDGIEINVSVGAAIIGSNVTNFKLSDDRPVFNLFRDEIASGIQHSLIPIRYANTADRGNPEGRGPIFATEYPWGYASSFFESGVNSFDEALIWVEDSTGLFRPELTLGDLAGELFDQTKWVLDKTTNLIRSGTKRVLDAVDSGANFVLSGVNTIGRKAGDAAAGFFAWIDGQANSPVLATVTTGVPDDATFLRFDLAVADVGNNDTLLVAVGDQVIGQVDLAVHKHAGNGTVELWVGDYAGMNDVELSFFMPSETASSAEFTIGNVEYLMLVTEATDTNSPFPISETFFLHSNPGASKRIFLDFDGHVTAGTLWNSQYTNGAAIVSPAYSSEGDGSFSV
ncbi:MAG: fibronectin type III domain-containing protein, partial [Planctomycetota bacterium]|nr:fibronectin type III domain-containing protein [Planctomycetota bacterium]